MGTVREYKDSVFSWLFSDPGTLRELYGALKGVAVKADIPITINTLEGVLFKARMNDVSFMIGDALVILFEHQSTVNENMPLRMLLYIARVYEAIIAERDVYRERRIPLPSPEFIVLYNGKAPYPDEKLLRLSDAFRNPGELGIPLGDFLPLELVVRVYNINSGHNGEMLERCETLKGYSVFVDKVRGYEGKGRARDEAIGLAVKDCIAQGILKEFLERHGAEVVNMLFTEWNWDDAFAVQREEGWEEGLERGKNMVLELVRQGYSPEQIEAKLNMDNLNGAETAGK